MRLCRHIIILFPVLLLLSVACLGQQPTPKAAVESFYRFDAKSSQTFNRKNIEARRKWLGNSLFSLLEAELAREREFLKANPSDKPHFGDGLPFRPLDEACQAGGKSHRRILHIGEATQVGETATVPVTFAYPAACGIEDVVYKIKLVGVKTQWLIVDVEYPNGETLTAELKRSEY